MDGQTGKGAYTGRSFSWLSLAARLLITKDEDRTRPPLTLAKILRLSRTRVMAFQPTVANKFSNDHQLKEAQKYMHERFMSHEITIPSPRSQYSLSVMRVSVELSKCFGLLQHAISSNTVRFVVACGNHFGQSTTSIR